MAINQTAFPNIATPKLKKTSISLGGNFGGQSNLGNVSPIHSKVSSASHIKSLKSQRRVLERVIELEKDVIDLGTRVQMQDESLVSVRTSVSNIQQSIGQLQSGQQAILENAQDKEKIEARQRQLEAQRIKREKAEGTLEGTATGDAARDVDKTLGPAEQVGKKAQGFLEGIKKFFMFVAAGWLTDKTIQLINAFTSGNKDEINKIGKKLLLGASAIGGIMLLAAGAIGPVLAGIGSLIGVIGGLLFNPVTLTALLIAVGVGGAIFGIKKLWDWGRNKATGGQSFTDKHKELDKKMKDAGMTTKGLIKNGMKKSSDRTEEQEKIFQEVEAERKRLNDLRDQMNAEIKQVVEDTPKSKTVGGQGNRKRKVHSKEDKDIIKQKQDAIRAKYQGMVNGSGTVSSVGSGENVSSNVNASDVTSTIGPEPTNEGKVTVLPVSVPQKEEEAPSSPATSVEFLPSNNPNNMHVLTSKTHYNVVG